MVKLNDKQQLLIVQPAEKGDGFILFRVAKVQLSFAVFGKIVKIGFRLALTLKVVEGDGLSVGRNGDVARPQVAVAKELHVGAAVFLHQHVLLVGGSVGILQHHQPVLEGAQYLHVGIGCGRLEFLGSGFLGSGFLGPRAFGLGCRRLGLGCLGQRAFGNGDSFPAFRLGRRGFCRLCLLPAGGEEQTEQSE